jgi:hypothetical protein
MSTRDSVGEVPWERMFPEPEGGKQFAPPAGWQGECYLERQGPERYISSFTPIVGVTVKPFSTVPPVTGRKRTSFTLSLP